MDNAVFDVLDIIDVAKIEGLEDAEFSWCFGLIACGSDNKPNKDKTKG